MNEDEFYELYGIEKVDKLKIQFDIILDGKKTSAKEPQRNETILSICLHSQNWE